MSGLQVKHELDYDLLHGHRVVVRILYRRLPTRRWTRFVVVPDDGQSVADIISHADEIAILHDSGKHRDAAQA